MNRAEQRFEQIEQYLRGRMPAGEATAFESEMAADPELAELVQQHRLERQGLEWLVERDLLAKMPAWDRETAMLQPPLQARRGGAGAWKPLWRVAAALTVAVFGWWLLRQYQASETGAPAADVVQTKPGRPKPAIRRPSPAKPAIPRPAPYESELPQPAIADQTPATQPGADAGLPESPDYAALADEFYRESDFLPPRGSKDGSGTAAYGQALDDFRGGRYGQVITQLQPTLHPGAEGLASKELAAHALYKSGRYDDAFRYFREIANTRKPPYAQRAEWAMALSLLRQMPEKKPLLERILSDVAANPQHAFYSQAKALQTRL